MVDESNFRDIESLKHFTVRDKKELAELTKFFVKKDVAEQMEALSEILKKEIEEQFIASMSKSSTSFIDVEGSADASAREQVITAIRGMELKRSYKDGNIRFKMVLKDVGNSKSRNGLIKALNNGTGVFNPKNGSPIRPKHGKKYLFIPGERFASKGYSTVIKKASKV